MAYPCNKCDASFPVRKSMLNHKRLKHGDAKQFNFELCVYTTTKKDHLTQHVRSVHKKINETCETCGKNFSDKSNLNKHKKNKHPENKEVTKRKATNSASNEKKEQNFIWMMISLTQTMRIKFSMKHTISIIRKETR